MFYIFFYFSNSISSSILVKFRVSRQKKQVIIGLTTSRLVCLLFARKGVTIINGTVVVPAVVHGDRFNTRSHNVVWNEISLP